MIVQLVDNFSGSGVAYQGVGALPVGAQFQIVITTTATVAGAATEQVVVETSLDGVEYSNQGTAIGISYAGSNPPAVTSFSAISAAAEPSDLWRVNVPRSFAGASCSVWMEI